MGPGVGGLVLEVAHEVLRGAGLVGAVHDGDLGVGQGQVLVLVGDGRIVPLDDLAVEDLGGGVGIEVDVLAGVGNALQVEDDGDRGDVDRHVERGGAVGARLVGGLGDLVIGEGLVGAGPRGGAAQEGGDARAGTGRVVGDVRAGVRRHVGGDPGFLGRLLGGGTSAGEAAGNLLGRGGTGVVAGGRNVVATGGERRQHHDAGNRRDGTNEEILTHCFFPLINCHSGSCHTIQSRFLFMTVTSLWAVRGVGRQNR